LRIARFAGDTSEIGRAWATLVSGNLKPSISEDPRYKAYVGYVATQIVPPRLGDAREAFEYAFAMKYEPEIEYLRAWYAAEQRSGHGGEFCERIVEFVSSGRSYSEIDKIDFLIGRGARLYSLGKELRYTDQERAVIMLKDALITHLKTFRRAAAISHPRLLKVEEYTRNTAFLLFSTFWLAGAIDDLPITWVELVELKDAYLDPIELPIMEYAQPFRQFQPKDASVPRYKGRLNGIVRKLGGSTAWEELRARDSVRNCLTSIAELLGNAEIDARRGSA
jgi:hypothetical protein